MSTAQADRELASTEHLHKLAPVLGEQWQMSWTFTALVGWFAALFLLINHTPLALDHTWHHANLGGQIVQHGALPTGLLNVPLSEGMPLIAESWLFDSAVFLVASDLGPNAISAMIAILASVAVWLWCGLIYRASASIGFTFFSAIVLGLGWTTQYASLQPQLPGMLIFAAVIWVILPAKPFGKLAIDKEIEANDAISSWRWLAVAILFATWSNVDGSFWLGLFVLLGIALGKAFAGCRQAGLRVGLLSSDTQRWVLLLQFSFLATLLNPLHIRLWQYAVTDKLDALVHGVWHGAGLYMPTVTGLTIVGLLGYVAWSLLKSKRNIEPAEIVVTVLLAGLVAVSSAKVYWCLPVLLMIAAGHRNPVAPTGTKAEEKPSADADESPPLRFAGTLLCLLFIWCAFALSTVSAPVLGGVARSQDRMFHADVPRDVSQYLRNRATREPQEFGWTDAKTPLTFGPADWSDWLLWDGGSDTRVFASSQIRQLPQRTQFDYHKVFHGQPGWDRILDRYAVVTLVIDKARQPKLSSEVMRHGDWQLVLETSRSLILERVSRAGGES